MSTYEQVLRFWELGFQQMNSEGTHSAQLKSLAVMGTSQALTLFQALLRVFVVSHLMMTQT